MYGCSSFGLQKLVCRVFAIVPPISLQNLASGTIWQKWFNTQAETLRRSPLFWLTVQGCSSVSQTAHACTCNYRRHPAWWTNDVPEFTYITWLAAVMFLANQLISQVLTELLVPTAGALIRNAREFRPLALCVLKMYRNGKQRYVGCPSLASIYINLQCLFLSRLFVKMQRDCHKNRLKKKCFITP